MMNKIADCPVTTLVVYGYFEKGLARREELVSLFLNGS